MPGDQENKPRVSAEAYDDTFRYVRNMLRRMNQDADADDAALINQITIKIVCCMVVWAHPDSPLRLKS